MSSIGTIEKKPHPARGYAWACASVAACTFFDALVFDRLDEANLVLVYLLGVTPVALLGRRGPAIAASVLATLAFDWFFVPPFYSFAVSDTQYLFTFLVMGLVGLVISTLTARLSAEASEARQRERRARALYELSRALLAAREPGESLAEGARVIGQELGLPVSAWLRGSDGEPRAVGAEGALDGNARESLRWVVRTGAASGPGTGTLPGADHIFLPVRTGNRIHGALGLAWPPDAPPPAPEVREALETGANQLAIALDQAHSREEAQVARAQAEAEALRSTLLSAVSHDLRTPLTGIVGAASTLAGDTEALAPSVRRELARGIMEEGQRLARLVTKLLHASKLEGGTPQLRREWWSLEDVLSPALARHEGLLGDRPIGLELAPDLPMLYVDATLLEQVFANLFENIASHTPPGTPVTVSAHLDGAWLAVEVRDAGPGLPEGEEENIFDKFRRYARVDASPGAGLGLAICRGVVEAHGGRITAANLPGGGSAFRFRLPLSEPPATR